MKICAIANQKGGVGKSIVTVHLAHYAAEKGLRVLVVDFDAQRNTTKFLMPENGHPSLFASMLFQDHIEDGKAPVVCSEHMRLISGDSGLKMIDAVQADEARLLQLPRKHLRSMTDCDLIVIDTPPTNERCYMAALVAADAVLTPFTLDGFTIDGTMELNNTFRTVQSRHKNPALKHIGIVANRVNPRGKSHKDTLAAIRQSGIRVMPTVLIERAAVQDSIWDAKPVWKLRHQGASGRKASHEMRAVCAAVCKELSL